MTFEELYKTLVQQSVKGKEGPLPPHDDHQLDCLLHPEKYPPVIDTETCVFCQHENACQKSCIFDH